MFTKCLNQLTESMAQNRFQIKSDLSYQLRGALKHGSREFHLYRESRLVDKAKFSGILYFKRPFYDLYGPFTFHRWIAQLEVRAYPVRRQSFLVEDQIDCIEAFNLLEKIFASEITFTESYRVPHLSLGQVLKANPLGAL